MGNKDKRKKYLKRKDQSAKKTGNNKPMYIIGVVTVVVVLGVVFMFSTAGRNLINSGNSKKNKIAEPVQNTSGQDRDTLLEQDISGGEDDKSGTLTDEKKPSGVITEKKSDKNIDQNPDNFVTISLSDITRQGKYYTYTSRNNVEIKYFALMDQKGVPHIAIDACDVCYRSKRGYALQGDQAICRNCGNRYPIAAIGTENKFGGCWPSYLPMEIVGNEMRIPVEGLEVKEFMFS